MKRITDKDFRYVHSSKTDVGATIRRERKRLAKIAELQAHFTKVTPIRKEAK